MPPKLVIFDCDGVLVDSEGIALELMVEDLNARGFAVSRQEYTEWFVGGTLPGVKAHLEARGIAMPADWADRMYDSIYAALAEQVEAVAGVHDLLDHLDAHAIDYCVASNGRFEKMQVTLGRTGLWDRFVDRMYSGQALGTPKPAPDMFLKAAADRGVLAKDCIVVEDSTPGARAARAAGMVCFGYSPHGDSGLAAEGARLFSHMEELPALIGL